MSFMVDEMHVTCLILVNHHAFHFFHNHPTSIKWFVSRTVRNRMLNPCFTVLSFVLVKYLAQYIRQHWDIDKIKQLHYNFGSVYIHTLCLQLSLILFQCFQNMSEHGYTIKICCNNNLSGWAKWVHIYQGFTLVSKNKNLKNLFLSLKCSWFISKLYSEIRFQIQT